MALSWAMCLYKVKANQTMYIFRELKECCFLLKSKGIFQHSTSNTIVEVCGRWAKLLHILGRKENAAKSSVKVELAKQGREKNVQKTRAENESIRLNWKTRCSDLVQFSLHFGSCAYMIHPYKWVTTLGQGWEVCVGSLSATHSSNASQGLENLSIWQ